MRQKIQYDKPPMTNDSAHPRAYIREAATLTLVVPKEPMKPASHNASDSRLLKVVYRCGPRLTWQWYYEAYNKGCSCTPIVTVGIEVFGIARLRIEITDVDVAFPNDVVYD